MVQVKSSERGSYAAEQNCRFLGDVSMCHSNILLPQPICRSVSEDFLLYKFWRIFPGIFLEDFSGHFSHKNEEKKSGEKIREKNLAAQK